jgi:arabinofuranan 3-O-arabinosyltransferase
VTAAVVRSVLRHRLLAAVTAVVALLPWFPNPGRIVADTKIDLVLSPWAYLGRAQSAWDSHAFFGQLQNQAYGYLFPMGPFFGVNRTLGVPEWATQRLWWSVVLVTAFAGCYLLVRRLGLAGPRVAMLAAFAFAASPRMLTVLGPISIEGWPSAMTPWLVLGAHRLLHAEGVAERRRAAALLGLLVFSIGGVNATATLAALVLPSLYLLTAGRRGVVAMPWWAAAVLLGTLWWLVPLLVLGSYAYPFLDFIESSSITTAVTSVPNVLRGTSHWVAFAGGSWPAGAQLISSGLLLVATTAVAVLGLLSLLTRRWWAGRGHVRTFALTSVVLGVVAIGVGFGANLDVPFVSPAAGAVRELLDGSLAALRNVHKLDPVVRLPLVLALAVGLSALGRATSSDRRRRTVLAAGATAVVLVAASPVFQFTLTPGGSFTAVPDRWREAATYVDRLAAIEGGSTLVAPATRFGEFLWGDTQDDPLEALSRSPIVNRDAIPLGSPGAIRQMDALDGVLSTGTGSTGLAPLLARAGITRVVVPHDYRQHQGDSLLDPAATDTATRVEQSLKRSGLTLERAWGEGDERLSIWSTGLAVERAQLMSVDDAVGLTGGPEGVVQLATAGVLDPHRPYVLAGSGLPGAAPAASVQTDTLKKRLLDVSRSVKDEYSDTRQPRDVRRDARPRRDFPPAGEAPATTRVFRGITDVRASSTSTDPRSGAFRGASTGVASAFDADYDTAWVSGGDAEPSISFDAVRPTRVGQVRVRVATVPGTGSVDRVELTVDGSTTRRRVVDPQRDVVFDVDATVRAVRVRLVPPDGVGALPLGIANIAATGLDASTGLQLPRTDARGGAAAGAGQVVVSRDPWSTSAQGRSIDDGRVLTRWARVDGPRQVGEVVLRARATPAVEELVDGWDVSGPRWESDLRTRPGAALDRDPSTRWTVGYLAGDPRLRVGWDAPRTLTGLSGLKKGASPSTTVSAVTITDPATGATREWTRKNPEFAPLTAREVVLTLHLPASASFPLGLPDLSLVGVGQAPASQGSTRVAVPCQLGATVDLGGAGASYTATVSRRDLQAGTLVAGRRCAGAVPSTPTTASGELAVRGASGDVFEARSVATADTAPAAVPLPAPAVQGWTNRDRSLAVPAAGTDRLVVWHEGFNRGWRAEVDGRPLAAVEVDGWRQAFVVPAGVDGVVTATFAPDRAYRGGLAVGAGAVLALLVLAVWPVRRRARPRRGLVGHRPARWTPAVGPVAAVAVGLLMGGWAGLVVGAVAALVPTGGRRRLALVGGALLVLTSTRWLLPQDGAPWSVLPQAVGLLLVCLLARELGAPVGTSQERLLDPPERGVGEGERDREGEAAGQQG